MSREEIGAIRKWDQSEVRVATDTYKDRKVVDIRVWFRPDGGSEYIPSKKGVTIDLHKVEDLIDVLETIRNGL